MRLEQHREALPALRVEAPFLAGRILQRQAAAADVPELWQFLQHLVVERAARDDQQFAVRLHRQAIGRVGGEEDLVAAVLQRPADEEALGLVVEIELAGLQQGGGDHALGIVVDQLGGQALVVGGAGDHREAFQDGNVARQEFVRAGRCRRRNGAGQAGQGQQRHQQGGHGSKAAQDHGRERRVPEDVGAMVMGLERPAARYKPGVVDHKGNIRGI